MSRLVVVVDTLADPEMDDPEAIARRMFTGDEYTSVVSAKFEEEK